MDIYLEARVWNATTDKEVELWIYGTNNVGRVVYTGTSADQAFTQLGTDDGYSGNSSSLVQDFNIWRTISLGISYKTIHTYIDDISKGTKSFNRDFGTIKGIKVTFRGKGALGRVRLEDWNTGYTLYEEQFEDCNSICSGCVPVRDMTQNSVPSGSWKASTAVISDGDINGNNNVHFQAGSNIELQPGFTIRTGGLFQADIANCGPCIDPTLINSTFCTFEYDPVCGCDGKNYSNPCKANNAGVTDFTYGTCP